MRIIHSSDLHGSYKGLLAIDDEFDLWIDTGDFFPNKTRGNRQIESRYQAKWVGHKSLGSRLVDWLNGRPLISIGGNHDYISLASVVAEAGGEAHDLSDGPAEVLGLGFAGFRQIPWIIGEWNGETHDFTELIAAALNANPDMLVTHAPPAGILDSKLYAGGIPGLATALTYGEHKICAHFFGHVHHNGGKSLEAMGIRFMNGATTVKLWEV
jgi:Icc-related predicted phosphoesterase